MILPRDQSAYLFGQIPGNQQLVDCLRGTTAGGKEHKDGCCEVDRELSTQDVAEFRPDDDESCNRISEQISLPPVIKMKIQHTCIGDQIPVHNPTCFTEALEVVCYLDKRRTDNGYF